jgi:hypothetical protein
MESGPPAPGFRPEFPRGGMAGDTREEAAREGEERALGAELRGTRRGWMRGRSDEHAQRTFGAFVGK